MREREKGTLKEELCGLRIETRDPLKTPRVSWIKHLFHRSLPCLLFLAGTMTIYVYYVLLYRSVHRILGSTASHLLLLGVLEILYVPLLLWAEQQYRALPAFFRFVETLRGSRRKILIRGREGRWTFHAGIEWRDVGVWSCKNSAFTPPRITDNLLDLTFEGGPSVIVRDWSLRQRVEIPYFVRAEDGTRTQRTMTFDVLVEPSHLGVQSFLSWIESMTVEASATYLLPGHAHEATQLGFVPSMAPTSNTHRADTGPAFHALPRRDT